MAHRRGGFTPTPRRRKTQWFGGPGGTGTNSLQSSTAVLLGSSTSPAAGQEDHTLVRTRGLVQILLTSVAAAGDGFFGAVGIGIATTSAIAAGVASVPTPLTELSWDGWIWHHFFSVHAGITAAVESESTTVTIPIDSKAMRKLGGTNMGLYAAIEGVEEGTATAEIWLNCRMLHKLP